MSLASAQEFLERAVTSPELSEKIQSAQAGKPLTEIFAAITTVGQAEGFDFTPEEGMEAFMRCRQQRPLSEQELEGVAGGVDFGTPPPGFNPGVIFSGSGSVPMTDAAGAWSALAGQLQNAANNFQNAVQGLAGNGWQGPSPTSMAAANQYVTWLTTLANLDPGKVPLF